MTSDTKTEITQTPIVDELWARVEAALPASKGMYHDGCHKIYLAMDDAENARFTAEDWEFSNAPDLALLHIWFDNSCSLRFISAVRSNADDPNAGYEQLIAQFDIDDADTDAVSTGAGDTEEPA
jgi:hypothetical protein